MQSHVDHSLVEHADPWILSIERFQSLADNVNWAFDTDQNSEDPIMITVGADYLELKTGADGVSRWYDPWHDIYESTADDADIIACRAQGPYQGRTVMAVLRDIRVTNYPNAERWVIHICKSALIEQRYQTGVPQVTIDLLDVTRNMIYLAPKLYEKMSTSVWSQFYIDSFRWIDYILLNALLNIRQVEDSEASSSDTSTAITDYSPWDDCLDTQTETIGKYTRSPNIRHCFSVVRLIGDRCHPDCQALYAVAANLYYNGIAVDKNGEYPLLVRL